jgi:hypothetical protein
MSWGMLAVGVTTAAIGAAGTVVSSSMQADAAKKAAGASGKVGKDYSKQLSAATETYNANLAGISSAVSAIDPTIKIPGYSLLGTPDVYKTDKNGNIKINKKTGLPVIKNKGKASAVLEGIQAANKITENALFQLENVLPGAAAAREKAMKDIAVWEERLEDQYNKVQQAYPMLEKAEAGYGESRKRYEEAGQILQQQLPQVMEARKVAGEYLTGDLPDVTKRQITKAIAEFGGAAYNPESARMTSGFQVPQGLLAENLAQAAEERQRFGLNAVSNITGQTAALSSGQANVAQGEAGLAQGLQNIGMAYGQAGAASANMGEAARGMQATNMAWQNLSQSFLQNVPQMMQVGLAGRGQDIQKRQIEIDAQLRQQELLANIATQQFGAVSGALQQNYNVGQQNVANTLASRQAGAQLYADIGQGISSIGSTAMNTYNQYATAAANTGSKPVTGYGGQTYVPYQGSGGTAYRLQ